jgi:hypothetical protein
VNAIGDAFEIDGWSGEMLSEGDCCPRAPQPSVIEGNRFVGIPHSTQSRRSVHANAKGGFPEAELPDDIMFPV